MQAVRQQMLEELNEARERFDQSMTQALANGG